MGAKISGTAGKDELIDGIIAVQIEQRPDSDRAAIGSELQGFSRQQLIDLQDRLRNPDTKRTNLLRSHRGMPAAARGR